MTSKTFRALALAFVVGFVFTLALPPPQEANAQVSGPTTRTPFLTVTPGATSVQNLTINGTCTGCPTSSPGGSTTQVQFNNAGAFGGDAGFTYVSGTDTGTIGTLVATTGTFTNATVGSQTVCTGNGTGCEAPLNDVEIGSFTATFSVGCTGGGETENDATVQYMRIGDFVTLAITDPSSSILCVTSTATTWEASGTPVPSSLRPINNAVSSPIFAVSDNGATAQAGQFMIGIDGGMDICRQFITGSSTVCTTTSWTASGTKRANSQGSWSYYRR